MPWKYLDLARANAPLPEPLVLNYRCFRVRA